MTKVHPNASPSSSPPPPTAAEAEAVPPTVFTVWTKSLLFNCRGFAVYDSRGDLAFRLDSYGPSARALLLMDAVGAPLLTLRRKRLALGDCWAAYRGEGSSPSEVVFQMRRAGRTRGGKKIARADGAAGFVVEGSYAARSCVVYDASRRRKVAEIKRKEAVGSDVFRLEVVPGRTDADAVAMAVIVVLEQMFGSR